MQRRKAILRQLTRDVLPKWSGWIFGPLIAFLPIILLLFHQNVAIATLVWVILVLVVLNVLQVAAYYRMCDRFIPRLDITFDHKTCIKSLGDRLILLCVKNLAAVALEGVRVELVDLFPLPENVTWIPIHLHWMHDRTRGAESQYGTTIDPYKDKYVAVACQFGREPRMAIVPDKGVMQDDPLLIPFQQCRLTVEVSAKNSTPIRKTLPIEIRDGMIDMFLLENV